ncbi:hypothetical protein AK812_SmicGene13758 [Symbiodinium microadriaticum]|uniref:Secreted protein n=1 Tax=Symbiodinium microadriaticum TaxID=2951 RepID=A0A1Q9E7C4_SYMMI|nr:hypothetical protein AK812_SmicGene13758 [Symbiodinium microadriaticum]
MPVPVPVLVLLLLLLLVVAAAITATASRDLVPAGGDAKIRTVAVEGEAAAVVVVTLHHDEGARVATSAPLVDRSSAEDTMTSDSRCEKARMHRDFVEAESFDPPSSADKIRDQLRDRGKGDGNTSSYAATALRPLYQDGMIQRDGRQGARPNADDKKRPED